MNRSKSKRCLLQVAVWAGLAALCAGVALAQAPADASQNQAAAASASNGQRTDGQIEMDVVHALDAAQPLKDDLITAATIQGEVTLSGTVSSQGSKDLAGSVAAQVPGVTKVHNNLTIGNPQQAAQAENLPDSQADDQAMNPAPGEPQAPPQNEPMPQENGQAEANQAPPPSQGPPPSGYPAPYPQARPQYSPYPAPPNAGPQYGAQQPPYGGQQPPYPDQQSQYGYPQRYPQRSRYPQAAGPVTVPQGMLIQVRTSEPVDSKHAAAGTPVQFTVIRDVTVGGVLAIPRGATLHGVITDSRKAGKLAGNSELALTLTSLDLGGRSYPVQSDEFRVRSPNKANETVGNAIAGGLLGTIIGCAAGRGPGCAIGAGAGLAAGTAASAASSGPRVWIPAEAQVSFHLDAPLTVDPVSQEEADRLAQGLYPGGPTLYRRGYPRPYPYGYYYRPYGYPYAPMYAPYPPVFYRPYYMMGGVYYWC